MQVLALLPGRGIKDMADLEGPEPWTAGLQIALGCQQQLIHQAVAQMAVIRQQGIGQGQTTGRIGTGTLALGRAQRKAAGFLKTSGGELPAQAALSLLFGPQAPRGNRIG